ADAYGAAGMYALNYGFGDSDVTVAGTIGVRGDETDGALAVANRTDSQGVATVSLMDTGRVTVTGDESSGLRTLNRGLTGSLIQVEGLVEVVGNDSTGLKMEAKNAANAADLKAILSGSAAVTTNGQNTHGAWLIHAGSGLIQV